MANSGLKKLVASTALLTMALATTTAGAATKGRIIPTDTVTFHKDGEVLASFTDQAPINDSALITCNKACSVRLDGLSLNVADETTFAVKQDGEGMNLYLKEGLATFSVNNVTQQLSFYTPDGRYVKTEGFIAPASSTEAVKGYINITETQAQIGITQGGMILATADGIQTIDPGYSYTVGLNDSVGLNDLPATSIGAMETGTNWAVLGAGALAVGALTYATTDDDNSSSNLNIASPTLNRASDN